MVNVNKVPTKFPHFWSYAERVRNQILVRRASVRVPRFRTYPLKPHNRSATHHIKVPKRKFGALSLFVLLFIIFAI